MSSASPKARGQEQLRLAAADYATCFSLSCVILCDDQCRWQHAVELPISLGVIGFLLDTHGCTRNLTGVQCGIFDELSLWKIHGIFWLLIIQFDNACGGQSAQHDVWSAI